MYKQNGSKQSDNAYSESERVSVQETPQYWEQYRKATPIDSTAEILLYLEHADRLCSKG